MTQAQSERRRLTGAARRERIETAAVEVFAARGYDATALGEVAAAAGVTRTVLYDHFRSKRSLYLHVLSTQNAAMLAEVGAGITGSGEGQERMRATIAAYLGFTASRPAARRLLMDPVPSGDPELEQLLASQRTTLAQTVAGMLAPDLARAGILPDSPTAPMVVELLISGVDGVARWWGDHPEVSLEEATDAAFRVLWQGLPRFAEE